MSFLISEELKLQLKANLERLERVEIRNPNLRRAAVAVTVTSGPDSSEACILLTRRSVSIKRHAGQYALPGGRIENGENAKEAAIREMEEEIGIKASSGQIIGCLDDFGSRSGFRITPVVVWSGPHAELNPDPQEVQKVFHIPLTELNQDGISRISTLSENGKQELSLMLPTLGHSIYAPTAAILYQFREVALRNQITRVGHFEQPRFAWK